MYFVASTAQLEIYFWSGKSIIPVTLKSREGAMDFIALNSIAAHCSLFMRTFGENVVAEVPVVIPILYAFNICEFVVSVKGFGEKA